MSFNRRFVIGLLASAIAPSAWAQEKGDGGKALEAAASPLGDRIMGNPNAKVTLVEFASATCPHCAEFQLNVFPTLKSEYIDKGLVKYIFREFPLDKLALGVAMLTRCLPEDKFFVTTDMFFRRQERWARAQNPRDEIVQITKLAGMDDATFDACMKNKSMADAILEHQKKSAAAFGIKGTPAVFVNGAPIDGPKGVSDVKKAIDAAIAANGSN